MASKESIKFTVEKSRQLLKDQIESFRILSNKAGIVLNLVAVFIPLYLFVIDKSNRPLLIWSAAPLTFLFAGTVLMMLVLYGEKFYQGISEKQFDELINSTVIDMYLLEIGANVQAIQSNEAPIKKINKYFSIGIRSVGISLLLATILLYLSSYTKISSMAQNKNNTKKEAPSNQKVVIPVVPTSKLTTLKNNVNLDENGEKR